VFVPDKAFQSGVIFASKVRANSRGRFLVLLESIITKLIRLARGKHTSLFGFFFTGAAVK
jgi:hypothetical protein